MCTLWPCVLILLVSTCFFSAPARAQSDDDFATHNRFIYGKNSWAREKDRAPVVHEPAHDVQNGEVKMAPLPMDSLQQDPASRFGKPSPSQSDPTSPTQFGQPAASP